MAGIDDRRPRMAPRRHALGLAGAALAVALAGASCGGNDRATRGTPSTGPAPTGTPLASSAPIPARSAIPSAAPTATAIQTASTTPSPTDARVIPSPATASFYAVPHPLPPGEPGSLVWAQRVAAPTGAIAWRVLYHSRSVQDADIAVSGLVVAPDRAPPPGGWPVLAYAHGSTGLADRCAPSRDARPLTDTTTADPDSFPVPALWQQGFVVAATDYEGLGTPGRHPYVVGASEGRGVLDSVRAARLLPGAHAGTTTAVLGASQGGHAALFAGEIATTYAPDLPLIGVVALAPASELATAARLIAADQQAVGFAVAIAAGVEAAYPEADLSSILTPRALRDVGVIDTGCLGDVVATFARPADQVFRLDRLLRPPWPALLEENSPGRVRTEAPIFVAQGGADPLVAPVLTDALVERLCATGDTVTSRRYPGATHVGIAEAARADIAAWLSDRLAGVPAANERCPER